MKRTLLILLLSGLYTMAPAQPGATPEQRAQRYLDGQSFTSLGLTPEQKTKALAILIAQYRSLDSLSVTAQGAGGSLRPKRTAIMEAGEEKFRQLLSDQQKTAYNTIAQARPQGVGFGQTGGGFQGNRTPLTPEMRARQMIGGWMFEPLKLTAEQKEKAQAILVEQFKSMDQVTAAIPADLPMQDRQAQITALAPKLTPIKEASEKKFTALLDATQKKTYAAIEKMRPQDRKFGDNYPMPVGTITQNPDVHDPVMAKEGDTYYIFYTNAGISTWSSKDLTNWRKEAPVFTTMPSWVPDAVPGFRGTGFWAPDITYHNGRYYLYYSASTFGRNSSAIGLVTNRTLNPTSPDYKWEDQGKVVQSIAGRDEWNAIDPNLAFDENGTPWLNFGSFWSGIKLVKLEKDLKTIARPETWSTIASRTPGSTAVEGSFIFKKGKYYYLFVSWDRCCQGIRSDYNIRVGRSERITGPYLDKDGVDMARGGGTLVLGGDVAEPKVVYALGHNSAYTFNGTDYLVYHKYVNEGSRLGISKINWVDGWPVIEKR